MNNLSASFSNSSAQVSNFYETLISSLNISYAGFFNPDTINQLISKPGKYFGNTLILLFEYFLLYNHLNMERAKN